MKTTSLGGVVVIVVEDSDPEHNVLEFIAALRKDHPPYPFGFAACEGSTAVFQNDQELDDFIEGWCNGLTADA